MQLTIITFNIHHGKGSDGILSIERIAALLKAYNADLIGLNEVDKNFSQRSNYMDQPNLLSKHLSMNYVFGPSISQSQTTFIAKRPGKNIKREYGNVLLSPHSIIESHNHVMYSGTPFLEDRSLLEVTISIGNKSQIKAYVGHFSLQKSMRRKQLQFAKEKVQLDIEQGFPVVLMGDFNMSPTNKLWNEHPYPLQDTWTIGNHDLKKGATFPSFSPFKRLDYILTSKEFTILSAEVIQSEPKVSDHLPFVVTLGLQEEGSEAPLSN